MSPYLKACQLTKLALLTLILGLSHPYSAGSHCDTLDGPVVADAKLALKRGEVTPVLKWVKKEDENEIRAAFQKTIKVRAKGREAQELADLYFFETLVRVHRASEGAPYTGLQPAGRTEPAIASADQALASGSVDHLARALNEKVETGLRQRFVAAIDAKKRAAESVAAGRGYVKAYVEFIHYVEQVNALAAGREHQPPEAHKH